MSQDPFQVPPLAADPEANGPPRMENEATGHVRPHPASSDHQEALGFPGEIPEDWQERALARMETLLERNRSLRVYMDACVRCGACTDKCHFYLGTTDPRNMPVARQDLMRDVYRRHFTAAGRNFPGLVRGRELTREVMEAWFTYFHQCSQCRRCSVFCPYGIDTAEISMAAREILDAAGFGQKYTNEIIGKVHKVGNNLGLPGPALEDTLEGLEEDLKDDTGHDIRIPLDQEGADILLVTPSADFFAEPHVDGLMGYAKVLHQAGLSWTLSSYASEAANFGMFIGSYEQMKQIAERIRKAAVDLGVKRIVVGECGHAWRVAYSFWNTLAGIGRGADADDTYARALQRQLDPRYPVPQHICELTQDLVDSGAIRLDPEANSHYGGVTFHDSCNVARASRMGQRPGGQLEIPRRLLRASVHNFRDMADATIGDETFCCGGGGGLLTDELMELRVKGAQPRVSALRETMDEHGVDRMVAICAICKAQFSKVLPYYDIPRETVISLHEVVGNAVRLDRSEA
ncbi:MAG: (Fe-S)-binding protein [Halorhodospira halophila]|uniref:sulfate reduction electron transfer complex DsrMKJOP subunit DsrK n=1 Tax=Halorhodospira TaxID=85108 RepID=UPI001912A6D1|nr:(Fe-S)-binding protein [Halorhodospira halophila]MCG5532628.1 (Fe-S)-binding protein [Halorhodospira sp. 9621]MCG5537653.1 (Fe-S)-binding protein [Halorhodospira sp. 9622]MCG5544205.1 (Fe-S)-binding protein [Halorhodospira sp. 9628]MBK5936553.1 reductase [Halorhodospira halophila]MBK5944270.1 reductase [Halorhodospira halophila]